MRHIETNMLVVGEVTDTEVNRIRKDFRGPGVYGVRPAVIRMTTDEWCFRLMRSVMSDLRYLQHDHPGIVANMSTGTFRIAHDSNYLFTIEELTEAKREEGPERYMARHILSTINSSQRRLLAIALTPDTWDMAFGDQRVRDWWLNELTSRVRVYGTGAETDFIVV